jgi:tRNA-binding EMAP/Myf-like protein
MNPNIVTCKIVSISKHPNATRLKVLKVDCGEPELTQIVCGASNVKEGMTSVLAKIGAILPSSLTIQATLLRDVQSDGMLCSAKDLNISDETGIIDLPQEIKLGVAIKDMPFENFSSTPWHQFKKVEVFIQNGKKIESLRDFSKLKNDSTLISETYWDGENYLYRDFKTC